MTIGYTLDGQFSIGNNMGEVNALSWGRDQSVYDSYKAANTGISISTDGAANAVYGPTLAMLPYMMHNTLAVLGEKPYRTGLRFQVTPSLAATDTTGVVRMGFPTYPKLGTYAHVEMPYKVLAMRRPMDYGMVDLGDKGIDDVLSWQQYFQAEGETWLMNQNDDLLRRIEDAPKVGFGTEIGGGAGSSNQRVGLEQMERVISNYVEAGFLPDGYAEPWVADPAYAGSDSQIGKYRNPGASGYVGAASGFDSYVDANYTTGTTTGTATLRPLTIEMLDTMCNAVMPYWNMNMSAGKAIVSSYDTMQKIQGLVNPVQRFMNTEFVQTGVNGVNTVEGRGAGLQVAKYNNIPLLPDLRVRKGVAANTTIASETGIGRVYMINQDALSIGILRQPQIIVSDDDIRNGMYARLASFKKLAETQITEGARAPFLSQGKIIHIQ